MAVLRSFHKSLFEQPGVQPLRSMPLPIVYDNVPETPIHWEYRVLTIDIREEALPDAALLNELGNEGWLLAGIVDQKTSERSNVVHYYFVRQKVE